MEQITNYIKPELVVVAFVLYFIGMGIKKSETIKDKYITLLDKNYPKEFMNVIDPPFIIFYRGDIFL